MEPNPTRETYLANIAAAERGLRQDREELERLKQDYARGDAWRGLSSKEYYMTYRFSSPDARRRALERDIENKSRSISAAREKIQDIDRKARGADGLSSTGDLARRARRGDPDATAALKARERFLGRARFATRQIPSYDGPTTGKPTGIYQSPLSGREVIVREGSALDLPPPARASYTEVPAQDVWTRDYKLTARVREPQTTTPTPEPRPAQEQPAERRYPRASATVPVLIVPPSPENLYGTAQPEETGTLINVPRYFSEKGPTLTVEEYKRPRLADIFGDPGSAIGFGELREGEIVPKLREADILGATSSAFQTFSYKFLGGTLKTGKAFIEQPAESVVTLGAYVGAGTLGTLAAGPVGGAGAVGNLFAAQNVFEARQGETPTIIRAFNDPITFAGEMAPFIAFEGVRAGRARTKAAAAEAEVVGTVATPATLEAVSRVPSVELRVRPLESVRRTVQTTESVGSSRTLGVQEPVFGEDMFLSAAEIKRQPAAFLTDTNLRVIQEVKPASGSVPGVSAAGRRFEAQTSRLSTASAEEVSNLARDRIIAAEARETGLSPYLERRTRIDTETSFTGYEPPAAWELTTKPGEQAGRPGPKATAEAVKQFGRVGIEKKGGMVGYEPKLDFFEEFFITDKNVKALIRESPYTGAREIIYETRPYVITEVKTPGRPPPPATVDTGTPSQTPGTVEVEVPQPDGTVKIQKLKLEIDDPAKQETTTIQKTEQKTASATKTATQQQQLFKPDARFKYIPKQETGKPFAEAIVRFKGLSKVGGFPIIKTGTTAGQTAGIRFQQDAAQATATTPAQDAAITTIQLPAQDAAQATAQEPAIRTATISLTSPDSLTRSRNRPLPEEITRKPFLPSPPITTGRKETLGGFGVSVRRFGKFSTVGRGLDFEEAVKKGAGIVSATAAASFRIEPEGEPSKRSPFDIIGRERYRPSKREPGVIVERSRFRISTPGEVGEISRKGQAASKRRRKKGLFGGGFKWGF